MPLQEDDPHINQYHDQPILYFLNAMHNVIGSAFQRRRSAPVTARAQLRPARTQPLPTPSPTPQNLSEYSTPAVPDSAWCSENFLLGAGMVIFQRSTHKVVILYETQAKYWFFPKGRKDIGESLETTAIREAYEEVRMPLQD
jgi:hypothetical protein